MVGGRHGYVCQNLSVEFARRLYPFERIEEDVQTFVVELVATARADDERVVAEFAAETSLGNLNHRATCLAAFGFVLFAGPNEIVGKSVRRNRIRLFAEQIFAFAGSDVADRQKCVVVLRTHLFDGVFGHDIELPSQIVGVEFGQIAVQGEPVARDATPHNRCVGSHDRSDVWRMFAQVETARGCHPFVEMRHDLIRSGAEGIDIRFDDLASDVTEQNRLDIVPLSRNRIDLVGLPQHFQHVILLCEECREVDEDCDWRAVDFPTTDADADAFVVERLPPSLHQRSILLELRYAVVLREIGTYDDIFVAQQIGYGRCFGGDDGVYAAYFVADFPTDFEQSVGRECVFVHNYFIDFTCFSDLFRCKDSALL